MSLKLKALHAAALISGVQFVYVCRFFSKELARKSPGQKLWETMDCAEALHRWEETTGAEHDEGQFTLALEAQLGQAGAIPRVLQPKQSDSLDFRECEKHGGVSAELSPPPDVRPTDAAEGGSSVSGAIGGAGAA